MRESTFGEKLRDARKKSGLTQKQLGELTGAGQVVIANYERGARFPGEEMLRKLAESLQVSLDYLLSVPSLTGTAAGPDFSPEHLFDLLLGESVARCWDYISQWKDRGKHSALDVYSGLLIPLLKKTGDLWFTGDISVLDEHLISGKVRELITLTAAHEKGWDNPPEPGLSWMGLCAPGEEHDLVLLMTARLLRLRGWDVRFAGTKMPVGDLIAAVEFHKPLVLSLSVTMDSFRSGLETYLHVLYKNRSYPYGIILGGSAVKERDVHDFPGIIGTAGTLEEGISLAEKYANDKRSS
ncbi:MAG: helix-turn-helix domain-containing protein [Spirochaetales bacterium]|nr:helix-turn-helix domain-containing protein [Spirochaetales bacterium]